MFKMTSSLAAALALLSVPGLTSAEFLRSSHGRELGYTENEDGYSDTGYCYMDQSMITGKTAHATYCALDEAACFKIDNGVSTPYHGTVKWRDHSNSLECSASTAYAVELGTPIERDADGDQGVNKDEIVLADIADVVVGMAVVDSQAHGTAKILADPPTFVTAVDAGTKTITLNRDSTSDILDGITLKLYPASSELTASTEFGGCYMMPGSKTAAHVVTPCIGPWAGGSYFYPGQAYSGKTYGPYTHAEVPIGYCKSSNGKTQTGTDIPGGGYCALSAEACDKDDNGVTSLETFLQWDHDDNPSCKLSDLIGKPVEPVVQDSGATSVKSSVAAVLLAASATVAGLA